MFVLEAATELVIITFIFRSMLALIFVAVLQASVAYRIVFVGLRDAGASVVMTRDDRTKSCHITRRTAIRIPMAIPDLPSPLSYLGRYTNLVFYCCPVVAALSLPDPSCVWFGEFGGRFNDRGSWSWLLPPLPFSSSCPSAHAPCTRSLSGVCALS